MLCVITRELKDQSWQPANEAFRLLRRISALCWARFQPDLPFPAALDRPAWPGGA